jgi:hypothetical protein
MNKEAKDFKRQFMFILDAIDNVRMELDTLQTEVTWLFKLCEDKLGVNMLTQDTDEQTCQENENATSSLILDLMGLVFG